MTIRVLRVLEYTYKTAERMTEDMSRWGVGALGVRRHGDMTVRSSTFIPEHLETFDDDQGTEALQIALNTAAGNQGSASVYSAGFTETVVEELTGLGFTIVPLIS